MKDQIYNAANLALLVLNRCQGRSPSDENERKIVMKILERALLKSQKPAAKQAALF